MKNKFFNQSFYNSFGKDTIHRLFDIQNKHSKWVESNGWRSNKTSLEVLSLIGSEVQETWDAHANGETTDRICEELSDVVLRTIDFVYELSLDTKGAVHLPGVLVQDTVVDHRFRELDKANPTVNEWTHCLFNKVFGLCNKFRSKSVNLNLEDILDIQAALNQVVYMCFGAIIGMGQDPLNCIEKKVEHNLCKKSSRDK